MPDVQTISNAAAQAVIQTAQNPVPVGSVLAALVLGGLLGVIGQVARAAVGLKGLHDEADSRGVSFSDLFIAARLVTSLLIGFVAGIAATIAMGFNKLLSIDPGNIDVLLGIIASGYAGTDFIEGFISQYLPSGKPKAKDRDEAPANREPAAVPPTADSRALPDAGTAPDAGDAAQLSAASALAAFAVSEGAFEPHEWANDSADPQRGVM